MVSPLSASCIRNRLAGRVEQSLAHKAQDVLKVLLRALMLFGPLACH